VSTTATIGVPPLAGFGGGHLRRLDGCCRASASSGPRVCARIGPGRHGRVPGDLPKQAGQERVAGERVAGERVAGERVAGERVAGERVAGERVAGEPLVGEEDMVRLRSIPQILEFLDHEQRVEVSA
jgi:hypothetical protein